MGTQEEEAAAMDRINQEAIAREVARIAAEEAARKAAEEAARKAAEGNQMVADGPATAGWPDNEVQQSPQGRLDKVAGALRVGQAGDVAFARDLLNSGQAPLSSTTTPEKAADGAKEGVAGSAAAKPALGLG